MPFYDYSCPRCGSFALRREVEDRNLATRCPECQGAAVRVVSAPHLGLMPAQRRQASARNEKSRHEPAVSGPHRCLSGCDCGHRDPKPPDKPKRTVDAGKFGRFQTSRKNARPWMLGH